jgi:hypothetical protein
MLGLILVILDAALRHPSYRGGSPYWLLNISVILICIALLVGVKIIPLN